MGDPESNISAQSIDHEIYCPCCGGKLQNLVQGKKDTCGYDDCRAQFSLRIYDKGLSVNA